MPTRHGGRSAARAEPGADAGWRNRRQTSRSTRRVNTCAHVNVPPACEWEQQHAGGPHALPGAPPTGYAESLAARACSAPVSAVRATSRLRSARSRGSRGAIPGASSQESGGGPWPVRRGIRGPAGPPRSGRGRRDVAVGLREPDEAPRARDDAVDVVASPAGRQPAPGRVLVGKGVETSRRGGDRGRAQAQVCERVEGVAVAAMLADQDRRPECRGERREQHLESLEPRRVGRARLQRDVDRRAVRFRAAAVVHEAGPGEEREPSLMERDRQHVRIVPEDRLHAVAVVDVEVHVQDAVAGVPCAPDGERHVVVDAEAACAAGHRVVEAAAWMEGVELLAGQDPLHRGERSAGDGRGRLVHAVERGVVAPRREARLRADIGVLGEHPHRRDVVRVVHALELGVRDLLGNEEAIGAERPQEVDPGTEPAGRQRVVGPEVVVEGRGAVDHQGLRLFRFRVVHGPSAALLRVRCAEPVRPPRPDRPRPTSRNYSEIGRAGREWWGSP